MWRLMHPVGAYSLVAGAKPVTVSVRPGPVMNLIFWPIAPAATPVLMLVKTTFCNAARAAIRALISKITSAASVTPARRLAPNRYFLRATPGPGICSSPLGTRAWRISQLNAAAVRIAVSQWHLSFARRSPVSTSRNLLAHFATDVEHVQPAVRYQP